MMPPETLATRPSPTLADEVALSDEPEREAGEPDADPGARLPAFFVIVRKYLTIFRVSLSERMTYRGDFLIGTLLRFLPMVTTILLWQAIYVGSGRSELAGFRYNEMIAYLLLVHISRMFSSMPGLAGGIAREIRDG